MKRILVSFIVSAFATLSAMADNKSVEDTNISGTDSIYANSLMSVGQEYAYIGEFEAAEENYLRALKVWESNMDEYYPHYVSSLIELGKLYNTIADYQNAEHYLLEAIALTDSIPIPIDCEYATLLKEVGMFYYRIGDYQKAERYYLQLLEVTESLDAETCCEEIYKQCLEQLVKIYKDLEDEQKEQYYRQFLDPIKSLLFIEEFKKYFTSENTESGLRLRYKRPQLPEDTLVNVEQKIEWANAIAKDVEAEILSSIVSNVISKGNGRSVYIPSFKELEEALLNKIETCKTIYGFQHPIYIQAISELGDRYVIYKYYSKAEPYIVNSANTQKNRFIESIKFMSEKQRSDYWQTLHKQFDISLPLWTYRYHYAKPSVATYAYDNELFRKGVLLQSSDAIRRSVLESGDTTLIRQWNEMTHLRQTISALQEKTPSSPLIAEYEQRTEQLEKSITRSSAAYRENLRQWNISWDSVRAALKPNQVAIEYMSASLNEDSLMYCALLLRDTCSYPIMIPLFEVDEVREFLDMSSGAAIDAVYTYDSYGEQLSQLIWSKVLPYLNPGEVVFFAPTGLIHEMAIENLPYDATHTMGDVYNLVRLSSTRELVLKKNQLPQENATLYGGINYKMSVGDLEAQSEKYKTYALRSVSLDTIMRSYAQYLPGTKTEVEKIEKTLKGKNISVQLFTYDEANEESFKVLSGAHRNILHIATHGFYWPDTAATDPLDRCGLLFAGANIALSGRGDRLPEGVQDGILTAKEISTLDLRDADIVVLSACETGLGDITGDGVFGLQRAFKIAGAQTILMTLWKVDDDATQRLMTAFYRHLSSGQSKRQAFRRAQQEVRNYTLTETRTTSPTVTKTKSKDKTKSSTSETVTTQPYTSPYFWAGFILLD